MGNELVKGIRKELSAQKINCITCWHFDEKNEICKIASARPPARVIALGCSSYSEEVPF